ncbi:MAG: low-specificity L-threonine aldolase [Defluviitaleaceae bacterium]|nr:low-specificity L-threonine aldolase [Defluviitaleaceae bacterium]
MRTIDLRSDTVTRPTDEMRKAMAQAEVGDDVYEDDPTVNKLEEITAKLLNKEAALFVPSGTFGNQVALLTHCRPGDEVILGDDCHIVQHESGAAAIIAGVQLRAIESSKTEMGQMPLDVIESRIRKEVNIHYPRTSLICLENAHGSGCVLPLEYMEAVAEIAHQYKIPVHLDGARMFNAAEFLKVEPHKLVASMDSIMFCLSKGLCAPVGSMLAGTAEFIEKARRNRKIMGGGMRQAGILASAGIIAIEKMRLRLEQDHKNARLLAKWLRQIKGIVVQSKYIQTNMVFCKMDFAPPLTPEIFVKRLSDANILVNPPEESIMRFVTHNDVREMDIQRVVEVIKSILTRDFW